MKKIIKYICIAIFLLIAVPRLRVPLLKMIYPVAYTDVIEEYSQKHGVDKYFIMAIISSESNFKYDVISKKNAKGLMQLTNETAEWCINKFSIESSLDTYSEPRENINIGCAYFGYLMNLFGNDEKCAIAAYNAGPGKVGDWLKNNEYSSDGVHLDKIPFEETETYVKKVMHRYGIYKEIY